MILPTNTDKSISFVATIASDRMKEKEGKMRKVELEDRWLL